MEAAKEPIDVGEDQQPVALPESGQRLRRVGEGGPITNRTPKGGGVGFAQLHPVLGPDAAQHLGQDLRIGGAGVLTLDHGLHGAEGGH